MHLIEPTKFFIAFLFLIILSVFACHTKSSGFKVEVGHHGALKNMMQKGDISAKAELPKFKDMDHLYALGALEDLKGEIQIFDSHPFVTFQEENKIEIDSTFNRKASLLVYAQVEKWNEIIIPEEVNNYNKLEKFIFNMAKASNINPDYPFPFLLEGEIRSLDWHIINWKEGDAEHTHEKHISSGPNGTLLNHEVVILGFYSDSHHGIFTHHTTNIHMHMKTIDNEIAGHVDDLLPGNRMILKLPIQIKSID